MISNEFSPTQPPTKRYSDRFILIAVLFLASITYFSFMDQYPLLESDEGRYAEIAREMLETGDFITPHLNYVKYFEKPPLFYWLIAMSLRVFGQNEIAIRMVSSLTGFLTILLIMGLGKRLFNTRVGVMAGWIYLTSILPLTMARLPIIDGFFSLCLSATWGSWWLGYKASTSRARQGWHLIAWACLGLATMTKGIAAIALTGFIIFLFLLLRRNWSILKQMAWWPGLLIFLIISLPWHVAAYFETPEFAHFYFVVQHVGRLVGDEHVKPFWFFLAVFPIMMMPWGTLLFPTAWDAIRRSIHAIRLPQSIYPDERIRKPLCTTENEVRQNPKNEIFLFLVIWIVAVIGLFSISRSKLIPYILPACPAASLLLADYLENEGLPKSSNRWCILITALLLFAMVPVIFYVGREDHTLPLSQMTFLISIVQVAFFLGGLLLLLSVFRIRLIPGAVGFAFLLILSPIIMGAISVVQYTKIGTLAKALPHPLPPQINIAEWRTYDRSLSFYSQRRIILVDEDSEISFGKNLDKDYGFFREGTASIRQLSKEGPLLLNIKSSDWPTVKSWEIFKIIAANNKNILLGNETFFHLTGLKPWPENALQPAPRLLLPQAAASGS